MNKSVLMYDPAKHKDQLIEWYQQWGWDVKILDMLPTTGLIVEGVCALFLYETNSTLCIVESFISNRYADKEEREKYIDIMCKTMLHYAKEKGFKYMKGDTKFQAVIDRVIGLGFSISPEKYTTFYRSL